jgi:hypothetical protein
MAADHNPFGDSEDPSPDLPTFVGRAVPTPCDLNQDTGTLEPTVNWIGVGSGHTICWPKAVLKRLPVGKHIGDIATNKHAMDNEDITEFGWLIHAISGCRLARCGNHVKEIIYIDWQTSWIPVAMVRPTEVFTTQLESARINWRKQDAHRYRRGPRSPERAEHSCLGWLARQQLLSEDGDYRYHVRKARDYQEITVKGEKIPCVYAHFYSSWEHAGSLTHDFRLWKQVLHFRRRVAEAKIRAASTSLNEAFFWLGFLDKTCRTGVDLELCVEGDEVENAADAIFAKTSKGGYALG